MCIGFGRSLFRQIRQRYFSFPKNEPKNRDDLSTIPLVEQSYLSVSRHPEIRYRPLPDPLSLYVPVKSLSKGTIDSIVSASHRSDRSDWNFSRRTLLAFLLAIHNQLRIIEENKDFQSKFDEKTIQRASEVRKWLGRKNQSGDIEEIRWDHLETNYKKMSREIDNGMAQCFHVDIKDVEPYYELTIPGLHADINRSREYMKQFRSYGWNPKDLKLYWTLQQLEDLCPKNEVKTENEQTNRINALLCDPSDVDTMEALRRHPVSQRNHTCKLEYINKSIEKAVFDVPEQAQLIILTFANERSPGGGYLFHAQAQEEILLYNSDGYRSLLDLKYGRMGGGYAIPEFGAVYTRDIRVFDKKSKKIRKADMLVSACYCLTETPQLYDHPADPVEIFANTVEKFRAFIAAAVANTIGDGSNTYLLLGPIGTGAFGNDTRDIGYAFHKVLSSKMMGSTGPIRNAFANIWFVSTDKRKNEEFKEIFNEEHM
ncbi:unnamed protein product [Adineta ricciae]|uniref:Microbial-type PARG catalytic domain-containing protein n=1 Tax=Adineta ricciae TaxID=249248 RepID=A0A815SDS8_ADIRI|nr:unnamed protein product [Adineta ricciae]CAF1490839.1 unnamed protein product [Adineta ricciae]